MLRTLRARVTMVTVTVAIVAVSVTGALSLQLARASSIDEARTELGEQAELLASRPGLALGDADLQTALGGAAVGFVGDDGTTRGAVVRQLTPVTVDRLAAGDPVSMTVRIDGRLAILESRPTQRNGSVVLTRLQADIDRGNELTLRRLAIALAIGLVVAIVAGTLLARRLTAPLVDTVAAARRMAAGERGVRITGRLQPAEVAAVASALAALDEALETSEGRQREFLLSISHELRTPLTAVRGYAEALADGMVDPAEVATVGQTLVGETERLDAFVGDLLELARLEADDFTISPEPVDVAVMLEQTRETWSGRAATIDVALTAQASPGLRVVSDARRVRQLLDGLVENALRVSPAGSTIALSAADRGSAVEIAVADAGPGLVGDDRSTAFERGVLRDRYRDIRPVGTGLGLSIASRLANRLGGDIRVGDSPGGGATFVVALPADTIAR